MQKRFSVSVALFTFAFSLAQSTNAEPTYTQENFSDIETVIDEPSEHFQPHVLENNFEPSCKEPIYISQSPFYVSALLKDYDEQPTKNRKITEPLTFEVTPGKFTRKGVPAFSILKLLAPLNFDELPPKALNQLKVDVEVISLPNEEAINEMRTNRRLSPAARAFPIADEGDLGRFFGSALRNSSEYVFKVKDLTSVAGFPKINEYLKNGSIRFAHKDGLFLARECCSKDNKSCRKEYVFEVVKDDDFKTSIKRYFDNTYNYELFSGLFPVQNENLEFLSNILRIIDEPKFSFIDFKYFDTRGFVKIPLDPVGTFQNSRGMKVPDMQRGPLNSLHYKSDDPNANDTFGHPGAICAFFQAVKSFNKSCASPACQIQWGDFYHSETWYTHHDHNEGYCVDIRPMRKHEDYGSLNIFKYSKRCKQQPDGTSKCITVSSMNPEYDRAKTQVLINELAAAGGVGKADENGVIILPHPLFNDVKGIKGVTQADGHYNHIHVCFPPQSQTVINACNRP